MPQYKLNDIPIDLWARFKERAQREGWPLRALYLQLMEDFASGRIARLSGAPPEQMPLYAWVRPYYRAIVETPEFRRADVADQWRLLVEHVSSESKPGLTRLLTVPQERWSQILNWLHDTAQDQRPGPNKLSTRAIAWVGEGPSLSENRRAFQFEVLGLPPGQQAWIANFPHEGWRILRVIDGKQGHWDGHHGDHDEALSALESTLYLEED